MLDEDWGGILKSSDLREPDAHSIFDIPCSKSAINPLHGCNTITSDSQNLGR